MARFEVTDPTGAKFEITAPDNATDAEIQAYVSSQLAQPQQVQPQPAQPAEPQPTFEGGIPVDIYQQVTAPQLEGMLPPPEPTPLQQFGQQMMAPITAGERLLKSAARGAAGSAIALGELSPAFPGGEQPVKEIIKKAIPPIAPLFDHKSEGWVENAAEIAGGLLAPEGALLAAKPSTVKAFTKGALATSQTRELEAAAIRKAAKAAVGEFDPLDLWTPKLPTVENQTLGPVLKQELEATVAQQAAFEKQLAQTEANISRQTGRLIEREMAAKESAAQRIDRLSQESAMATANKEELVARAQTEEEIKLATLAERKAQGRLSKEAARITTDLQKERIRLLKQLQQKRAMRQDLTETADKLQENLIKQEQIKQTMKQTAIGVDQNLDWSRTFGATNIPEQIHARGLEQARLVDDMVKVGFVKPELADGLRNAVYTEVLSSNGIKLKSQKLYPLNLLNETFRWGRVQNRSGVPTGESVQKTIWALNEGKNLQNRYKAAASDVIRALKKSGISADDQVELLQYFQRMDDGSVQFVPDAFNYAENGVTKVSIPPYRGPALTAEQQAAFKQLRDIFDQLAYEADVPLLPRYVPIRELPQYTNVSTRTSAEAIQNATLAQARTSGQLVKGVHETNMINLMDRYIREVSRKKFIAPALEDSVNTLNQLNLSGLANESAAFKKWIFDAFNLNSEKEAGQVLGTYKLNQIKPDVDAFVKQLPDPDTAGRQIFDALSRAMYVKMVGINPTTWVKQFLQFPTIGSIELGERWVASGMRDASAKALTRVGADRIRDAKKILRASLVENSAVLESEFGKAPTNLIAKGIDFINAPARGLARRTMEAGEEYNRLQSVLAAQNKFTHYFERGGEAGIQRLLDESALTTTQRQMVSRAYLSGGTKNASDIYSLIMAQRINFAYGLADTPQLLRSEFGRLFPFLTYTRNILTRAAESISEGRPGDLAKLVYKPLMMLAAFAGATKVATDKARTLPSGSMPIEAVTDLYKYGVSASPQIMLKNAYKIISPIPFTVWDEAKFKKELDKKLEVFPEVGKSSPLYNELLKGFK